MRRGKMGGCKNRKLIGPYLDGQLGECHWLDEHISECSQCLAEYEAVQKINHYAGKVDLAPPESHYWKNFSARTMARIATRETQAVKSKGWLFFTGHNIPLKVFSLVATVILVIGVSIIALNYPRQTTISPVASTPANNPAGGEILTAKPVDTPSQSNLAISKPVESKAGEIAVSNIPAIVAIGKDAIPLDNSALPTIAGDSKLSGQFRYASRGAVNLVEPELPLGIGTVQSDVFEPNSDMIIVYQINKGSRAGEIPLMVYRQANVKFFGPDKAIPWRDINRLSGPAWGYAAGDNQNSEQLNNRLNMELDLSQDK
jgi:hypothetical protein